MAKYTPGSWQYSTKPQPNGCPIIGNDRGLMIAMLAHSVNCKEDQEVAIANARLIAAAPEMLEAIEDALATCERDMQHLLDNGRLRGVLQTAIAKAKGEQA